MKKTLLLFLMPLFLSAQIKTKFSIEWLGLQSQAINELSYKMPTFTSGNCYFDSDNLFVSYSSYFNEGSHVDVSSVAISNLKLEEMSIGDMGDLNLEKIPNQFDYDVRNTTARGVKRNIVRCTPFVLKNGIYYKVASFDVIYGLTKNYAKSAKGFSISNSVLADGDWYRFSLTKSGAYRLTKGFISDLGIDVSNVNPNNIKVYGNGGRMIPLENGVSYPLDLQEVAVDFIGNQDAVFGEDEYILFYGEGVDVWSEDSSTHNNLYASQSYYYIKYDEGESKRMGRIVEPISDSDVKFDTYDSYSYHESDLINPARLGRKWFGEDFSDDSSREFVFDLPNFDDSQSCVIKIRALAASPVITSMAVSVENEVLGAFSFSAVSSESALQAVEGGFVKFYQAPTSKVKFKLDYDNKGVPSSEAYLDYITVEAKGFLKGNNKQFGFLNKATAQSIGIGEYLISNAKDIKWVWDVTDIYNVTTKANIGQDQFSVKQIMQEGSLRKYHLVDSNDYYQPDIASVTKIANQNIKGELFNETGNLDYLIFTKKEYLGQAERLADFHRNKSGLVVKVLSLDKVYEEFSSGKQDIGAIRNVIKYAYDNAKSSEDRIKYVCLFGGASFDYKDRIPNNTNEVPVFHSNGYSLSTTFMSDDFYGLMDSNEGKMLAFNDVDVAVGRMVFGNLYEATVAVDKVIGYYSDLAYGNWRNNILLVSDDVDLYWEGVIQKGLDDLGTGIEKERSFFNVKKIHTDSYVQETSSGGERYPAVKEEIINQIENGVLVMDYFGHGGEDGLSHERLLEKSDIVALNNKNRLPLFITATCEFSRYDNPYRLTAGEMSYLNPNGGAIALFSTTRQIGVAAGLTFSEALMKNLFSYGLNEYPTIGEALRLAKNEASDFGAVMVSGIGDPALKLAVPNPEVVITRLNGSLIGESVDTLKALSLVRLEGMVVGVDQKPLEGYKGEVDVVVFDKRVERTTLSNDGTLDSSKKQIFLDYEQNGEVVFKGKATVVDGLFEVSFVVPKDIKIEVGQARVSLYSRDDDFVTDYSGYESQLMIGGFDEDAPTDSTPPELKLFMNNESFVNGGIVNQSPVLLAFLNDESGISTAGGVGHDIVAIVDNDESSPIVLNEYYSTVKDSYKSGELSYVLRELAPGFHTVKVRAWDVYNNVVEQSISFQVVSNEMITLDKVMNYPNPFVDYTEFWFNHNKPNELLEVRVQVFTVTGKLVKTIVQSVTTTGFTSRDVVWDGKDDFGKRIGKGVYVYKIEVKSVMSNQVASKTEKLVVF